MKIRDIHITPVAVPDPPLLNAAGLHAPYALRLIVEIVSADGISGWGEIPGSEAARAALETAAERLIGMDPWRLNAIDAALESLARLGRARRDALGSAGLGARPQRHRSRLLRFDGQVSRAASGRFIGRRHSRTRAFRGLPLLQI